MVTHFIPWTTVFLFHLASQSLKILFATLWFAKYASLWWSLSRQEPLHPWGQYLPPNSSSKNLITGFKYCMMWQNRTCKIAVTIPVCLLQVSVWICETLIHPSFKLGWREWRKKNKKGRKKKKSHRDIIDNAASGWWEAQTENPCKKMPTWV